MIRCIRWLIVCMGLALLWPAAQAGGGGSPIPATMTGQKVSDNQAFIGIQWNFGVRDGASVVVGYRWARVNSNNNVTGGAVGFNYAITGTTGPGELRFTGLSGTRSAQGEAGVGYSFHAASFLVNLAVQGPYAYGGVDYIFDKGWQPYIGVNTVHYNRVSQIASCPSGYTLDGSSCIPDFIPTEEEDD